jgi:hypothetical protein
LNFVNVHYGTAVAAIEYALPVTDSTISQMSGDNTDNAGLDYRNLPAGATVNLTRLVFDGTASDNGVTLHAGTEADPAGAALAADGFSLNVTGSDITGDNPLWVEDTSYGGDPTIGVSVTDSTLTETGGGTALRVLAQNLQPVEAAPLPGTAKVTVAITNSEISGGSSSDGVEIDATTVLGDALAAGTTCTQAAACANITVAGSNISADDDAVEVDVEVEGATNSSGTGATVLNYSVTGGSILSSDGEGWSADSDNNATGGAAFLTGSFSGTNVSSYDASIDHAAYAWGGGTTNTLTVAGGSILSSDDDAIQADSHSESAPGDGFLRVATTGTDINAYDQLVDADVDSNDGDATSEISLTGGLLMSEDDAIENDVDANDGVATGSPVVEDATLLAYYIGIDNDVDGDDGAVANPAIVNSAVATSDDDAIYNQAYSGDGPATANPAITDSDVSAYYSIIDNDADAYGDDEGGGDATANPTVTGSTLRATYDYAIDNYSYSSSGDAVGSPSLTDTTLTSGEYEAIYNEVYGDETAEGNPTLARSRVTSYDSVIYNYVDGDDGAVANPSATDSSLDALYDHGIDNYAYSSSGDATANPSLVNSKITGEYNGMYNQADANGGDALAAPSLASGSAIKAPDYYGIANYAYGSGDSGEDNDDDGDATATPSVTDSTIESYNYAIYNYAGSTTSDADASFTIARSAVHATYDNAVESEADSSGDDSAVVNPNVTSAKITSGDYDGMDLYVYPGTGGGTVGGSVTDSTITAEYDAVYVYGEAQGGAPLVFETAFTNSTLSSPYYNALYGEMYNYGDTADMGGSVSLRPSFTGGALLAQDYYALYLEAVGFGPTEEDVIEVAPVVDDVRLESYYGVYLFAYDYQRWDENDEAVPSVGSVHAGGSFTDSTLISSNSYGLDVGADCYQCLGGALVDTAATNTNSAAYDEAAYLYAYSDFADAPATVDSPITGGVWETRSSGAAIYAYADASGDEADATNDLQVDGATISGHDGGIENYADASSGSASNGSSFTDNVIDNRWSSDGDDGIYNDTSAGDGEGDTSTRTGSVSGNRITGMVGYDGDGIAEYVGTANPSGETVDLTIDDNLISNVGGRGISVETQGNPSEDGSVVSVSGNTINRTGRSAIVLDGVEPHVDGNRQSDSGLDEDGSEDVNGLRVVNSTAQGFATCNVFAGNKVGVEYRENDPAGDPLTNLNAFQDPVTGKTNRPYNLLTEPAAEVVELSALEPTDARNNWWGDFAEEVIDPTIRGNVDDSSRLTAPPGCVTQQQQPPPPNTGGGGGGGVTPTGPLTQSSGQLPPTPNDPFVVTVTSPNGGPITITENGGGNDGNGLDQLGQGADITAPNAAAENPLVLRFDVLASALPPGTILSEVKVLRDGVPVPPCAPGATGANPDPCEASRSVTNGVLTIVVRSSHASLWSLAMPTVVRLEGIDRIATAIDTSQATFPERTAEAVALARADEYPDALAGGPLAVSKSAPLLLTRTGALDPATKAEISRVLATGKTVYILGGEEAVSAAVANEITGMGYNVVRFGGADRFATAVAIADAVDTTPDAILVTTGVNFPDALAAGAAAPKLRGVVVLTDGSQMPETTKQYLNAHASVTRYAVGGPATAADPAAVPVMGADRYDTAVAVARKFFTNPSFAGVATGTKFPDAMTAGARLGRFGAPLVLSEPDSLPIVTKDYLTQTTSLSRAELYGGVEALSQNVAQQVAAAIG